MPTNYSTRPNKHVDRELFVELIGLVYSGVLSDEVAYISMGGPQMSDHVSMYRRNGIGKLYSFDLDPDIVKRQIFNAPTSLTVCDDHHSKLLPGMMDLIVDALEAKNVVVWMDYTGTSQRSQQLAEYQDLLQNLSPGDVARITLDASLPSEKLKAQLKPDVQADHLLAMETLLRQELGDYYPQDLSVTSQSDVAPILANSIERAAIRASDVTGMIITPLLITTYADTSPMITATVLIQDEEAEPVPPQGFSFLATDWGSLERLEVPELTVRERTFIDVQVDKSEAELGDSLGYNIASGAKGNRQWSSFKRYHRYLPQFQHVDFK